MSANYDAALAALFDHRLRVLQSRLRGRKQTQTTMQPTQPPPKPPNACAAANEVKP